MRQLVIFSLFLFSVLFAVGQSNENYIQNTTYKTATATGSVGDADKIESITYYDGLGRSIQSIGKFAGGNKEDIASYVGYDNFGRTDKEWLPFANGSGDLNLRTVDMEQSITNFYNTAKYENTTNPYSEKYLEHSPLSRVIEQGAPGAAWAVNKTSDSDHSIKFDYLSNSSTTEVRDYGVTITASTVNSIKVYTPALANNGYYTVNTLYKTVTKDENWTSGTEHTTEEFKDKQGRVVLKRTYGTSVVNGTNQTNIAHDTYYVYDDYGNLSYVIPPKVDTSNGVSSTELSELCYQYRYDSRHRLVEKKIPGKSWEFIVYDKLDRPILTSGQNWWYFTKYDAFGRVAYTGQANLPSFVPREPLQNDANVASVTNESRGSSMSLGGVNIHYTNNSYPTAINEVYTINYYDDYLDVGSGTSEDAYGITPTTNVKGLPTVSKVRVLDTNDWITTVTYYDNKARPIYVYSHNEYLETTDKVKSNLGFMGNVLESRTTHSKTGQPTITTIDKFTYDHMNRLLSQEQEIDGVKSELIVRNRYDELGQIEQKLVGGDVPIVSEYQNRYGLSLYSDGRIVKWNSVTQNAGLSTFESFTNNGYINFKATYDYYDVSVGLSYSDPDYFVNSIDYAINLGANGMAQVYEKVSPGNIVARGTAINYNAGDRFKIESRNNTIYYSKNGEVFYISDVQTNGNALYGDTAFTSQYGSIENFIIVDTDVALQTVDYTYNIRGWLKGINDTNSLGDDLFGFGINYNTVAHSGTALYNGNISETEWKTANTDTNLRWYTYNYDALNRITSGLSGSSNSAWNNMHNLKLVEYDKNGNITTLRRNGYIDNNTFDEDLDHLTYTYDAGNKLTDISEIGHHFEGFADKTNTQTGDYFYDANGNMVKDLNKDIEGASGANGIVYNHLNLPTEVRFGAADKIEYIYDATGIKLEKKVSDGGNDTYTHYAGNYVYQTDNSGSSLKFFNHPEGYIEQNNYNSYNYIYQYKDHLGNIRVSYKADDDLIYSEGFESASGWDASGHTHGWALSSFDSNFKRTGDYAGMVLPYGWSHYRVCHSNDWVSISNTQTTTYIISGWVYLENIAGTNYGQMYLFTKDALGTVSQVGWVNTNVKGQWIYLEKEINVAASVTQLNLRLDNFYGGKVWFDDLSIRRATDTPDLEILDENNYYPFGLKHKGYNINATSHIALNYKYNGKELNEELGLDWYDFGARNYEASLGRWMNLDPFAEKFTPVSPYIYAANSPLRFIDPDGKEIINIIGGVKYTEHHAQIAFRALQQIARNNSNNSSNIHLVYEDVTPEIYQHTLNAFEKGKPSILHYDANKKRQARRRALAMWGYPSRSGFHRDEYPYASTFEGGLGAEVAYVDPSENYSQGGSLRALYANMETGDEFVVLPVPSDKEPETVPEPVVEPVYTPDDVPDPIIPIVPVPATKPVPATPGIYRVLQGIFNRLPIFIITPPLMEQQIYPYGNDDITTKKI